MWIICRKYIFPCLNLIQSFMIYTSIFLHWRLCMYLILMPRMMTNQFLHTTNYYYCYCCCSLVPHAHDLMACLVWCMATSGWCQALWPANGCCRQGNMISWGWEILAALWLVSLALMGSVFNTDMGINFGKHVCPEVCCYLVIKNTVLVSLVIIINHFFLIIKLQ